MINGCPSCRIVFVEPCVDREVALYALILSCPDPEILTAFLSFPSMLYTAALSKHVLSRTE